MASVGMDSILYDRYSTRGASSSTGALQQPGNAGTQGKRTATTTENSTLASDKSSGGSVSVSLSDEALKKAGVKASGEQTSTSSDGSTLSEEDQKKVDELKTIDAKVRAHEQAHMAAGGELVTRSAQFEYTTGPDKHRYAVGGEVQIDVSAEKDPEETIRKANRVRQAALAPAEPSGQDTRVAADAAAMAAQASIELSKQKSGGDGQENQSESTAASQESGVKSTSTDNGTQNEQKANADRGIRMAASSAYQQQLMPQMALTFSQRMMSA